MQFDDDEAIDPVVIKQEQSLERRRKLSHLLSNFYVILIDEGYTEVGGLAAYDHNYRDIAIG